jgi:hypothetical protein
MESSDVDVLDGVRPGGLPTSRTCLEVAQLEDTSCRRGRRWSTSWNALVQDHSLTRDAEMMFLDDLRHSRVVTIGASSWHGTLALGFTKESGRVDMEIDSWIVFTVVGGEACRV